MKTIPIKTLFTPVLVAGLVVLALSLAAAASDTPKRRGQLHVIKDCTAKTGDPGSNSRERNRLDRVLIRPPQRIPSRGP